MSEPFLAEIRIFAFNYAPRGWAQCNGQLLPINQNQALFSLLGTTFGGNGQTTFALPDLRGRAPVHAGADVTLGMSAGEESHTLVLSEMPAHTHLPMGDSAAASVTTPGGNTWASQNANPYASSPNVLMNPTTVSNVGGSQPHANIQPYLVLNSCIALMGIFPSRN